MGADEVIDYKTENFEDVINDYDAVFDTVAGDTYERSFKVLKKGSGIIVSMLEQPNAELMNQYGVKAVFQFTQVNRERLTKLAEWVDQNNIKINVDKTFSLDEAAKALDYQNSVCRLTIDVSIKHLDRNCPIVVHLSRVTISYHIS